MYDGELDEARVGIHQWCFHSISFPSEWGLVRGVQEPQPVVEFPFN